MVASGTDNFGVPPNGRCWVTRSVATLIDVKRLSSLLAVLALALTQVVAGVASATPDLKDRLTAIPVLRVISDATAGAYRSFVLGYQQPVDHLRPWRGTFEQRISLLHRGEARPLVLHTTGYDLPGVARAAEPTKLVDGNQISVEQRFFVPSRPQPTDWRDLNIWQAASDHHRIVRAFQRIYRAKWLSTGASKGGMTSIYHRRFFPRDVDGTIAYVTPNDVVDSRDSYGEFIERVGDDDGCNRRLEDVQRQILRNRDEFVARMLARGYVYDRVFGSPQKALEILVLDMPFTFWQYGAQADCALVPGAGATVDQLVAFIDKTVGFDFYNDRGIAPYTPYYYQAGTQLGSPLADESHVAGLLRYPGSSVPRSMVSADIEMRFQPGVMRDIDNWVRSGGSQLLFVYGENDPWSAEPFRLGHGTRDSFCYTVPGGNHGSDIAKLPAPQREAAAKTVRRWAGVKAPVNLAALDGPGPDDLSELRRRPR